jgi:hypothetical protein
MQLYRTTATTFLYSFVYFLDIFKKKKKHSCREQLYIVSVILSEADYSSDFRHVTKSFCLAIYLSIYINIYINIYIYIYIYICIYMYIHVNCEA